MTAKLEENDWSVARVVEVLRKQAGEHGMANVQVFLDVDGTEDVLDVANRILQAAIRHLGQKDQNFRIGKVHRVAKSFSVRASLDVIAKLGSEPGVRALLPTRIEDVYPKPVHNKAPRYR